MSPGGGTHRLAGKRARSDKPHGASCNPYPAAPSSQGHTLTEATPVEQSRDAADEAGTGLSHGAREARPRCIQAARFVELLQSPCGPGVHGSQPRQLLHPWQEHNLVGGWRVAGREAMSQPHSRTPMTLLVYALTTSPSPFLISLWSLFLLPLQCPQSSSGHATCPLQQPPPNNLFSPCLFPAQVPSTVPHCPRIKAKPLS